MQQTIAELESALTLAKSLADSSRAAKAVPADTDAQQQVKDELDGLKQRGLLASAPGSIGVVSGRGVHVSAQENISAVVGKNADFSVVKRFTVAAGELVSIFAQKMGLKLFAAKGPVEVQAQTDAMTLASDKDMTITSVNGKVTVAAAKELILECDGAFVQLKDGNITLGGPADLFFKVITIQKQGQASQNTPMPALPYPAPGATDLEFRRIYADGSPVAGCQYIATLDDGTTRSGTLNAEGYVRLTGLPTGMGARIRYLDDPNPHKASITAEHDSDMNDVMPQNNEGEQA